MAGGKVVQIAGDHPPIGGTRQVVEERWMERARDKRYPCPMLAGQGDELCEVRWLIAANSEVLQEAGEVEGVICVSGGLLLWRGHPKWRGRARDPPPTRAAPRRG